MMRKSCYRRLYRRLCRQEEYREFRDGYIRVEDGKVIVEKPYMKKDE